MNDDVINFLAAIGLNFPYQAPRDRYGRFVGPTHDGDRLRALAVKHKVRPAQDRQEQAGEVARALLDQLGYELHEQTVRRKRA